MENLKWSFKGLVAIGFILLSSQMASAADPLMQVCGFTQVKVKSTGPLPNKPVPPDAIPKGDKVKILEAICKAPQLFLSVGQFKSYKSGSHYAFFLIGREGEVREANYYTIETEFSIRQAIVTMDDGVQIPTYIFGKSKNFTAPKFTVLSRTPYMGNGTTPWISALAMVLNHDVNFVLQPARGTSMAGGEFEWLDWKQEAKDARATLDWISAQPWSNKKIYVTGTSYDGFLAMAAATTRHPNLVAVIAASGPWNPSTDSLSMSGFYGPSLSYAANLNWDGNLDSGSIYKISHTQKTRSYTRVLDKSRSTFGVKLKSLSPEQLQKNSEDFVAALKKATAIMFYGYGVNDDQDSRDVINLSYQLKGLKNHYFLAHTDGHSQTPLEDLIFYMMARGDMPKEKLAEAIAYNLPRQNCLITSEIKCYDNRSEFVPTIPHVTKFETLENKGKFQMGIGIMENTEITLFGQREIKFELDMTNSWEDLAMVFQTYYCETMETCIRIEGDGKSPMITGIKKGLHTYTILSQHENYTVKPGKIFLNILLTDRLGVALKDKEAPKIQIKNLEYTFPIFAP